MRLRVRCPHCRTRYKIPEEYGDKSLRCARCQKNFRVQSAAEPPASSGMSLLLPLLLVVLLLGGIAGVVSWRTWLSGDEGTPGPTPSTDLGPDLVAAPPPAPAPPRPDPQPEPPTKPQPATVPPPTPPSVPVLVWQDFRTDEGAFSVRFPGRPEKTLRKQGQGSGILTYSVALDQNRATFLVLCESLPTDMADLTPREILQAVAAGQPQPPRKTQEIEVHGHHGVEAVFQEEHNGKAVTIVERAIVGRKYLYRLSVSSLTERQDAAVVTPFFESFKPLAPPPAPPKPMPVVAAPPPPRPADKPQVSQLVVTLPEGWKADFNRFSQKWIFEREIDGSGMVRVTLGEALDDAADAETCATRLRRRELVDVEDSDRVFTEFTLKEARKEGFLVKAVAVAVKDRKDRRFAFVMVRTLNGLRLLGQGTALPTEALRDEVIAAFDGARFK